MYVFNESGTTHQYYKCKHNPGAVHRWIQEINIIYNLWDDKLNVSISIQVNICAKDNNICRNDRHNNQPLLKKKSM